MTRPLKPSGVPWLGDIPAGWRVIRNKNCFSCSKEIVGADSDRTQLLSLTTSGIKTKGKDVVGGKLPESFDTYQKVRVNNLVMCLFDMDCSAVFSGVSPFDGMISPAYKVLECKDGVASRFAGYWFRFIGSDRMFKHYAKNIRYSLTYEDFAELPFLLPPLPEQRAIADFLDERCAAIDAIVEEAKAGIEEYAKWKQSVVFEAVTKGLSPHAKRKDSGVEWIGEVPEEWTVMKLRFFGSLKNGISKSGDCFGMGNPFVSYSDVFKNDWIPETVQGLVQSSPQEQEEYSVQEGDVFFTRTSETIEDIGKAAVCLKTIPKATFAGFLIRVRPKSDVMLVNFAKYFFRNSGFQSFFSRQLTLVTRASLSQELLKNLTILIPPLPEQRAIAAYLDEKCSAIDALIEEKKQLIEDLGTYKKSLIYETVTGKRRIAG